MILFDNFDLTEYEYEARELFAEDGEDASEAQIYTRAAALAASDAEFLHEDITRHFNNIGGRVLAVGRVGTWRGTFDGGGVYDDFASAFYSVFGDCVYIKITDDGGRLFIEGAHHDGHNHAEFVTLTERGENLYNKWCYDYGDERTEQDIHSIIYHSNLFCKIPHFARDAYTIPF